MENTIQRILTGTIVKRTLNEIKRDPKRSIWNLVDMALQLSSGRFQQNFFSAAQQMLRNERSSYYDLVRNAVANTDTMRLYTFSMNLGYNGCTVGARRIRKNEKALGCNIPWTILLDIDPDRLEEREASYHRLMQDGEELGIYFWILFGNGNVQRLLSLAERHPDSAFVLLCCPEDMTAPFLERAGEINNLMLAVRYDGDAAPVYDSLRSRGLLYSVWYQYGQGDLDAIFSGELFDSTQQVSPIFTVLLRDQSCSEETQRLVHQNVECIRKEQRYRTVPWELYCDNCKVDAIISDEACFAFFNREGRLYDRSGLVREDVDGLFETGLKEILTAAFPHKEEEKQ